MLCTLLSGLSLTAFADDTYYTVSFSVPTGFLAPDPQTVLAGRSFQLPTGMAAPTGYDFVGWYENPIQNEIALADPGDSIKTGLYLPARSITLYACYHRTENIAGYYQKTTGEPASNGNKYLIVYESADKNIAFTNKPGTAGTAASHYNTAGDFINVTIANDQIAMTSDVEAIALTIRRVSTGHFSVKLPNGKYIGYNSGTDLKLHDTEYTNNGIDFDALGYFVWNDLTSTDRVFSYSTRYDAIKFYKDGSNLYLYERVAPRTVDYYTTNPLNEAPCAHENTTLTGYIAATCTTAGYSGDVICDDCGATVTAGSVIPALGHSYTSTVTTAATCTAAGVTTYTCSRCGNTYTEAIPAALGHSYGSFTSNNNGTHSKTCSRCGDVITANCDTNGANGACSVCGYQAASSACNHNFVDNQCTICGERFRIRSATLALNNQIDVAYIAEIPSGITNISLTVNGTAITEYQESSGYYYFFYKGVNPQCMGDNLSATLNGTYNGTALTATKATYSVRQYCVNRLKDSNTSTELRALVTALLVYGTRAQQYMNYNTSAYVATGDDIVNPISTAFTALSGYSASFDGAASADTYWISVGLTLTNGVAMNYRFYASNTSGLTASVELNGTTKTFTANDFKVVGTNVYEITFDGINADEYADTVTAFFERDEEQVGNTLLYSVNAYIQAKQNDSVNKLKNLVRALSVYGTCVEAYKNASN